MEPVAKKVARPRRAPAKQSVKNVSAKEHEEALNLFIRESSDEESDSSNEKNGVKGAQEKHEHSDEDDDVWEEVDLSHRKEFSFDDWNGDEEVQDLEVTLDRTQQSMRLKYDHFLYCLRIRNKSASAAEKKIRMHTHLLHVQCLLLHGSIRNAWLEDDELQVKAWEILA
jgi:xeroderma pigmentosum group C-complementing protein